MSNSREPVGNSISRHVTQLEQNDLVWDDALGRWRRVTGVWHYTAERSHQRMVKVVLDMSAFHRHAASEDAYYVVLTDDDVDPQVRPLSATERRHATRRGARDDSDATAGTANATSATAAEPAAESVVAEPAVASAESPAETPVADARQVDQAAGERVRREALGLSRGELSRRCELTVSALWRVENGRAKDDELVRVRAALTVEEERRAAQ